MVYSQINGLNFQRKIYGKGYRCIRHCSVTAASISWVFIVIYLPLSDSIIEDKCDMMVHFGWMPDHTGSGIQNMLFKYLRHMLLSNQSCNINSIGNEWGKEIKYLFIYFIIYIKLL